MLSYELKDWIKENLMVFSVKRQKNILVNKRLSDSYLTKINALDKKEMVFNLTSFLPEDRRFNERLFCILNDIAESPKCNNVNCNRCVNFGTSHDGPKYAKHCSYKCAQTNIETRKLIETTNLQRYQATTPFKMHDFNTRAKETWIREYGVDNPSKSEAIKQKKVEKSISVYGTKNVLQSEIVKNQIKNTNLINFGVENPQQNAEISARTIKTRKLQTFNRYKESSNFSKVEFLFDFDEFTKTKYLKFKCKDCGEILIGKIRQAFPPQCRKCSPIIRENKSKAELEITEFIKSFYSGRVENNIFFPNKQEIDIFIPELKIGFEFNGLYWHSEIKGKDRNYHLDKLNYFKSHEIDIFHIYEDDWFNCKHIIKSLIKSKFQIFDSIIDSKQCSVKPISYDIATKFVEENSLDFVEFNQSIGLFYKKELVSVLLLCEEGEIKFVSKIFTRIDGSAKMLFDYFLKKFKSIKLISYQDLDFRTIDESKLFELNFRFNKQIPPDFRFTDNSQTNRVWDSGKNEYIYNK